VQFLDLTLPTPEENLALDEALLITAESDGRAEFLRLWESASYFVVLGKNCSVSEDVWVERCQADGVPILRRVSGGGTVLQGPGCLNFAVILPYDRSQELSGVQSSFQYVLERVRAALAELGLRVELAGTSDLVLGDRKFCGNAQRRQRTHLLHQGSILHHFDLAAVARYLHEPQRQPAYRGSRDHLSFLTNLPADPPLLRERLRAAWGASDVSTRGPSELVKQLVAERYAQQAWNFRR
jgi:lipoate-protein ligase A